MTVDGTRAVVKPVYRCGLCRAPAHLQADGTVARSCACTGTIIASMEAVAYGEGLCRVDQVGRDLSQASVNRGDNVATRAELQLRITLAVRELFACAEEIANSRAVAEIERDTVKAELVVVAEQIVVVAAERDEKLAEAVAAQEALDVHKASVADMIDKLKKAVDPKVIDDAVAEAGVVVDAVVIDAAVVEEPR